MGALLSISKNTRLGEKDQYQLDRPRSVLEPLNKAR